MDFAGLDMKSPKKSYLSQDSRDTEEKRWMQTIERSSQRFQPIRLRVGIHATITRFDQIKLLTSRALKKSYLIREHAMLI